MKGWSIKLSVEQCEFLISHLDCTGLRVRPITQCQLENVTRAALIARELIRYDQGENIVGRPKGTVITDRGREMLGIVLGWMADGLFNANIINIRPVVNMPPKKRPKLAYNAPLQAEPEKATEGELNHA